DRGNGATERVSVDDSGAQGDAASLAASISADRQVVGFESRADNLVANDTNYMRDVFVRDRCDATWSNYGSGFAGTNGAPSLTSQSDPVLGTTLTLNLSNSLGAATSGLLFVGFQQTLLHSNWGGDLLVVPVLTLPVVIPAGGAAFTGGIPNDPTLCG